MISRTAGTFAILLLAAACAGTQKPPARDAFILLLPDDQGKTGSIVVSGQGGEKRVLSAPRQAVRVSAGASPGEPFVVPENEVRAQAGDALDALPKPPVRFILYFKHDSVDLRAESLAGLAEVIRTIRQRAPVDVSVVGHTDTVGDRPYNYGLSLKRAQAVARILAENGLDASVIEITSHGKDNPLVPTGDQVSEPRNRRVEVTVR